MTSQVIAEIERLRAAILNYKPSFYVTSDEQSVIAHILNSDPELAAAVAAERAEMKKEADEYARAHDAETVGEPQASRADLIEMQVIAEHEAECLRETVRYLTEAAPVCKACGRGIDNGGLCGECVDERTATAEAVVAALTLAERLSHVATPSTKHMDREERRDGIEVMLSDLNQLARRDGCIAAAWALEMLGILSGTPAPVVTATSPGRQALDDANGAMRKAVADRQGATRDSVPDE